MKDSEPTKHESTTKLSISFVIGFTMFISSILVFWGAVGPALLITYIQTNCSIYHINMTTIYDDFEHEICYIGEMKVGFFEGDVERFELIRYPLFNLDCYIDNQTVLDWIDKYSVNSSSSVFCYYLPSTMHFNYSQDTLVWPVILNREDQIGTITSINIGITIFFMLFFIISIVRGGYNCLTKSNRHYNELNLQDTLNEKNTRNSEYILLTDN